MNLLRILMLVFLVLGGYAAGISKPYPAVVSFIMSGILVYADRKFAKQDREWDKVQRTKQRLLLASEAAIELHECEAHALVVHNPSIGLQVGD